MFDYLIQNAAVLDGSGAAAVSADVALSGGTIAAMGDLRGAEARTVIDAAGVAELAKMPPKEVLVAKVLGGLNAPISGFVNVLNGNIRGLVVALNAIAEKQSA